MPLMDSLGDWTHEEKIPELEDMSTETSKMKKQKEENLEKQNTISISRFVRQLSKIKHMYGTTRKRRKGKRNSSNI